MAARNLELALRIRADLDEVKRELRALRGGVDKTAEGMVRMRRRASGLADGLTRAAVALASLAAGARAASNVAGFEASLTKIVGLVGLSRTEVEAMGEALLALAPTVAAGPGELAEALFFVTSAGARGAAALEIVETAAKAAAAEGVDLSAFNSLGWDEFTILELDDFEHRALSAPFELFRFDFEGQLPPRR